MEEVKAYKCKVCQKIYDRQRYAYECEFKHAQIAYANHLLKEGYNLAHIKWCCGFHWTLSKEQEEITKDSCFIISHWQCCDKPAYRITGIEDGGYIYVCGRGSWSGTYGKPCDVSNLPKPHPKEKLYVDAR